MEVIYVNIAMSLPWRTKTLDMHKFCKRLRYLPVTDVNKWTTLNLLLLV